MNQTWRTTHENGNAVKTDTTREAVEMSEAIKALQSQLADLRKIVQAAKSADDSVSPPNHRQ
ncbi:MAG: hypothetical protein HY081_10785 [Gammaproteobacteria bacterium]|nr:hypothetical protein [Gammaproteobacteria bacterium]